MNAIPRIPGYEDVLGVVYKALEELNQQRSKKSRLEPSPDCVLSGENGSLNSLELANFIVLTEQMVGEAFGTEIDLTENDPFSPESGHMRTAGSLASHISNLVRQEP